MIGQNAPPIEYTQPITVSSSETIVAIAVASGFANSSPTSATYACSATATPSFSLAPGEYTGGQTVSISDSTPNALIYYTLDGTTPTTSSTLYQAPIAVTSSETIQAVAVATGYTRSAVAAAAYTVWPAANVNEWALMKGSTFPDWGNLGVPSINNSPAIQGVGRCLSAHWTDAAGNFWMFGGLGTDAHENHVYMNDLWEYTPSTNEWTWMGGNSVGPYGENSGQPGVYGTQGTPGIGNIPGGRQAAASWTDSNGNFWLFGGNGYDSAGTYSDLNDLWMFKPSTNQWTWVSGNQTTSNGFSFNGNYFYAGVAPIYGTLGEAAPTNSPGARDNAATWVDNGGNLWLFGGHGVDPKIPADYAFNDLWKFSPSTNEWTWISGSNSSQGVICVPAPDGDFGTYCGHPGTYGTLGTASASDNPGGRSGASAWIDGNGNLWLFGGMAFDANGNINPMNDLWEFSPSTSQWTWRGGNDSVLQCIADWSDECTLSALPVVYGTEGIPSAGNMPQYAANAATWTDKSGNFWLYSGSYASSSYSPGFAFGASYAWNGLWEFDPSANEWTWMNGTEVSTPNAPSAGAVLGTLGTPDPSNSPGGVFGSPTWADENGDLWMFDGLVWKFQPLAPTPVPSFGLSRSSAAIFVGVGSSGVSTLTTVVGGGFNSPIALSASGQPSGVTVQFSPATISGAGVSQVTFSVGASVATGSYTITITGASGDITASTVISLNVTASPPSFTLSAPTANGLSLNPGATGSLPLVVTPQNGFNAVVSFACSGLPAGATCAFSPTTVTPSGGAATTTLTITAPAQSAAVRSSMKLGLPLTVAALSFGWFGFRRRRGLLVPLVLAVLGIGLVSGCGGGGESGSGGGGGGGSTPVTSTVTITATSGTLQQTASISLTVN